MKRVGTTKREWIITDSSSHCKNEDVIGTDTTEQAKFLVPSKTLQKCLIIADRPGWTLFGRSIGLLYSSWSKILSPFEKNTVFTLFIREPVGTNLVLC